MESSVFSVRGLAVEEKCPESTLLEKAAFTFPSLLLLQALEALLLWPERVAALKFKKRGVGLFNLECY